MISTFFYLVRRFHSWKAGIFDMNWRTKIALFEFTPSRTVKSIWAETGTKKSYEFPAEDAVTALASFDAPAFPEAPSVLTPSSLEVTGANPPAVAPPPRWTYTCQCQGRSKKNKGKASYWVAPPKKLMTHASTIEKISSLSLARASKPHKPENQA